MKSSTHPYVQNMMWEKNTNDIGERNQFNHGCHGFDFVNYRKYLTERNSKCSVDERQYHKFLLYKSQSSHTETTRRI